MPVPKFSAMGESGLSKNQCRVCRKTMRDFRKYGSQPNGEMTMSRYLSLAAAALVATGLAHTATPVAAAPVSGPAIAQIAPGSDIETVRWGRGGWGWGLGAGLLGGAIIGGALAAPYYYGYGPGYYGAPYYGPAYAPGPGYAPGYGPGPGYGAGPGGGADVAYCARKYRSYDPNTGTFLGNDGVRHACP
jgi:hypothetical protein